MKTYGLIVNPTSGRGKGLKKSEKLRRRISGSSRVVVFQTAHRGDATEIAAEAARRVDRIIAIGGDGTLNEVLTGLMTLNVPPRQLPELGFLPAGTANVAKRAFDLSPDPGRVGDALAAAETSLVDVGAVHHGGGVRAFLLWFGAGWDGMLIHELKTSRSGLMGVSGLVGNVPRILAAIARYNQPPIISEVDGFKFGPHSSVIVANVGHIPFGGKVSHVADPGDGRFHVVGVPHLSVCGFLWLGFRMMTTSLTRSRDVSQVVGRRIIARTDGEVPFQVDGEPAGFLPATVTLMPGAVRLLKTTC